ncbi:MAG: DsbA family protein [Nannocystales bacterium]
MVLVVPKVRGLLSSALTGALALGSVALTGWQVEQVEMTKARDPFPTDGLPHKGASPQDARVAMVACSEFQCPFSGRARHTVEQLLVDNPDLAFFYTHLPLRSHRYAELHARASVAAQRQGRFWPMHDALYDSQRETKVVDEAAAIALARDLGLDTGRFAEDLRDPTTAAEVRRQSRLCTDQGVRAVPTFFINGREVRGALPTEEFQRVIDEVRG